MFDTLRQCLSMLTSCQILSTCHTLHSRCTPVTLLHGEDGNWDGEHCTAYPIHEVTKPAAEELGIVSRCHVFPCCFCGSHAILKFFIVTGVVLVSNMQPGGIRQSLRYQKTVESEGILSSFCLAFTLFRIVPKRISDAWVLV